MDVYHGFENETATMFFSLKTFSSFNNIFIKTYIYLERNTLEWKFLVIYLRYRKSD